MSFDPQLALAQIDAALDEWNELRAKSNYDDCSDQPYYDGARVTARLASTMNRLAPKGTYHQTNLEKFLSQSGGSFALLESLVGALLALRRESELGHVESFEALVHAATFAGFLDMADHLLLPDHLLLQGYKDAAAVITGSVLENHLRELGKKHDVDITVSDRPKKADTLNAELMAKRMLNSLDQKNVTSWLGLRNSAAHGKYNSYTDYQVRLMIDAVQDFLARHPA